MSKVKLLTWSNASKPVKVTLPTKEIELKQTRSLFAQLLIIARTQEELDLQNLIGRYELTCLPRSIFSADGSVLPCTDKSKLMSVLESLATTVTGESVEHMEQGPQVSSQSHNRNDPQQLASRNDPHQVRSSDDTQQVVSRYDLQQVVNRDDP